MRLNSIILSIIFVLCFTWNINAQTSLTNGDFTSMTIGPELLQDPSFDSGVSWNTSGTWTVSGGTATHIGGSNDNLISVAEVATIGECYQVSVACSVYTEDGSARYASERWCDTDQVLETTGTFTGYVAAVGDPDPTRPEARSAGSTTGQWTLDSMSVKDVSLDSWTEEGTLSITEYAIYNDSLDTVELNSSVTNQFAIKQALDNGDWVVCVDVESVTGSLTVTDGGANSQVVSSAG